MKQPWTRDEIEILKKHYADSTSTEIHEKYLPGRTAHAIRNMAGKKGLITRDTAKKQGLIAQLSHWTPEEDALLTRLYGTMPAKELQATHFPKRTVSAVVTRAYNLRLMDTKMPPWTQEEIETLTRLFGKIPLDALAEQIPNRNIEAIRARAYKLGLTNSDTRCQRIKKHESPKRGWEHHTNIQLLRSERPNSNNKTGVKGVHYDKSRGKYKAKLTFKGKQYNLGHYATIEEAAAARKAAYEAIQPELDEIEAEGVAKLLKMAKDADLSVSRETHAYQ